jgi:DNA invertase Pin-like site-specific DNA recombinase
MKLVAYYRALLTHATERALPAQRRSVQKYAQEAHWEIVAEFTEVSQGRKDTPELMKALKACKEHKARLVVARLDCLPGNLAFIAVALFSGINCLAVDQLLKTKSAFHALNTIAEYWR